METSEVLESGYGAGTSAGDNLCNDYARGLAAAFTELAAARRDRTAGDDDVAMTDAGSPSLFANVAVVRRPISGTDWPALAERVHAFYGAHAGGLIMVFSAWPTP